MQDRFLILGVLVLLGGCAGGVPDFVGREGSQTGQFTLGGEDPLPDPMPLSLRAALAERGPFGVIIRAEGIAPQQGYHSAGLAPLAGGAPDAAGVVSYALTAVPPETPQAQGPERTRLLTAATFLSAREIGTTITGVRVTGGANTQALALP